MCSSDLTYSVGKTNFWSYEDQLFGVNLPDNVGLTGHGLTGEFVSGPNYWIADGIPITPFTDANPTVEDPYQQALVILKDPQGNELHRSQPVIPVSTEVNCVSTGCHSSINNILNEHENEGGFDPNNTPILCAQCHGSTPLTGPNPGSAGWFSRRIHHRHDFIAQSLPGQAGCEKCHPGPNTHCLRGTMNTDYGMVCTDCHGTIVNVANTISSGRIPWLDEPACRDCHTAQFGEPVGVLFREATGHGGVMCSGCHGSPHAIFPSREARDNANNVALQGQGREPGGSGEGGGDDEERGDGFIYLPQVDGGQTNEEDAVDQAGLEVVDEGDGNDGDEQEVAEAGGVGRIANHEGQEEGVEAEEVEVGGLEDPAGAHYDETEDGGQQIESAGQNQQPHGCRAERAVLADLPQAVNDGEQQKQRQQHL